METWIAALLGSSAQGQVPTDDFRHLEGKPGLVLHVMVFFKGLGCEECPSVACCQEMRTVHELGMPVNIS